MEDEQARRDIGRRLREGRKGAKLSQEEAAAKLGVKRQAVSSWESGVTMPDSHKWYRIGMLYGMSLDYLIYGMKTKPVATQPILSKIFSADAEESVWGDDAREECLKRSP